MRAISRKFESNMARTCAQFHTQSMRCVQAHSPRDAFGVRDERPRDGTDEHDTHTGPLWKDVADAGEELDAIVEADNPVVALVGRERVLVHHHLKARRRRQSIAAERPRVRAAKRPRDTNERRGSLAKREAETAKPAQQHASQHMHVRGSSFSQHLPGVKQQHLPKRVQVSHTRTLFSQTRRDKRGDVALATDVVVPSRARADVVEDSVPHVQLHAQEGEREAA